MIHSAFEAARVCANTPPRENIETCCLVFFQLAPC